nr:hypothetical protein [Pseudomonas sp. FW300-N1A1]
MPEKIALIDVPLIRIGRLRKQGRSRSDGVTFTRVNFQISLYATLKAIEFRFLADAANYKQGRLAPDAGFAIENDTAGGIEFFLALDDVFERNQSAVQPGPVSKSLIALTCVESLSSQWGISTLNSSATIWKLRSH